VSDIYNFSVNLHFFHITIRRWPAQKICHHLEKEIQPGIAGVTRYTRLGLVADQFTYYNVFKPICLFELL